MLKLCIKNMITYSLQIEILVQCLIFEVRVSPYEAMGARHLMQIHCFWLKCSYWLHELCLLGVFVSDLQFGCCNDLLLQFMLKSFFHFFLFHHHFFLFVFLPLSLRFVRECLAHAGRASQLFVLLFGFLPHSISVWPLTPSSFQVLPLLPLLSALLACRGFVRVAHERTFRG